MHSWNAVLASLLILVATFVTPTISTQTSVTGAVNDAGKRLRRLDDTEERGAKDWAKMKYWVSADKSDDYVKNALKLDKLKGTALELNKKKFAKFQYKREGCEMDDWVWKGIPTASVWDDLGLAGMTAAQRKNSDALRKYERYATKYDDAIWSNKNSIFQPPIHYGGTPEEMSIKVQIWAKANRKNWYVEEMLGLDGLSKAARKKNAAYPYFLDFLKLTGRTEK